MQSIDYKTFSFFFFSSFVVQQRNQLERTRFFFFFVTLLSCSCRRFSRRVNFALRFPVFFICWSNRRVRWANVRSRSNSHLICFISKSNRCIGIKHGKASSFTSFVINFEILVNMLISSGFVLVAIELIFIRNFVTVRQCKWTIIIIIFFFFCLISTMNTLNSTGKQTFLIDSPANKINKPGNIFLVGVFFFVKINFVLIDITHKLI